MINAILFGVKAGLALAAAVIVFNIIVGVQKGVIRGVAAMLDIKPDDE